MYVYMVDTLVIYFQAGMRKRIASLVRITDQTVLVIALKLHGDRDFNLL